MTESEIVKVLGEPAVLELLAEECTELAQAALKMARKQRKENPTPMTYQRCRANLEEELADVTLCVELLHTSSKDTSVINPVMVEAILDQKRKRMKERMEAANSCTDN